MEVVLIGSGGCMRELAWQMLECDQEKWKIIGYVDVEKPENGMGVQVGKETIYYLGDDSYFEQISVPVNVVIAIGSSKVRKRIAEKLKENLMIHFPTIVLGNTCICEDVKMGQGCIVSMDCRISTNVTVGEFLFMNTGSMICHDGTVGDFVTLSPDVKLAGAVVIGNYTDIGMGTKVIQGIRVGADVIVGAGSIVVRDTDNNCTIVGVPAKKIRG